jgi:hypothetical protein
MIDTDGRANMTTLPYTGKEFLRKGRRQVSRGVYNL